MILTSRVSHFRGELSSYRKGNSEIIRMVKMKVVLRMLFGSKTEILKFFESRYRRMEHSS